MKRIFIAIKVNGNSEFRKVVSELKRELNLSSVKWTDTANLHLTLAFLGDTEEELIPRISRMLERGTGFGSFDFLIRGLGVFKNIKDPKVIWAGIEKTEKLNLLQSDIIKGLKDLGINTEDRPFSPHLTIGRIKHLQNRDALKVLLLKHTGADFQQVNVEETILFESILHPGGPEYRIISVHKL